MTEKEFSRPWKRDTSKSEYVIINKRKFGSAQHIRTTKNPFSLTIFLAAPQAKRTEGPHN